MGVIKIIQKSPRFGILFIAIILALIFTALDIVSSIHSFIGSTDGINPFWKLSLVFKCLTDAILLDDFKTELKRLGVKRMKRDEKRRNSHALILPDDDRMDSDEEAAMHFSNGDINGTVLNGHAFRNSVSHQGRGLQKSSEDGTGEQVEFMQALGTDPSQISSDISSSRRSSSSRPKVGIGGVRATKLPSIFQAIKPGKKSKKSVDSGTSLWSEATQDENSQQAKKNSRMKSHSNDHDDVGPDEIKFEDSSLDAARRMNEATIAELKRRKNSKADADAAMDDEISRAK